MIIKKDLQYRINIILCLSNINIKFHCFDINKKNIFYYIMNNKK